MGQGIFLALLLLVGLLALPSGALPAASNEAALPTSGFEFAIIGDLPYTAREEAKFPELVAAINGTNVVFVVHNDDFKSGSSPCTDALFSQRHGLFQTFKPPLIYVFGDNEWTDCHRSSSDPLERLAKLREIFPKRTPALDNLLCHSYDRAIRRHLVNFVRMSAGTSAVSSLLASISLGVITIFQPRSSAASPWATSRNIPNAMRPTSRGCASRSPWPRRTVASV